MHDYLTSSHASYLLERAVWIILLWCTLCAAQCDTDQYTVLLAQVDKADQELLLAAVLGNTVVCCTCGGALQPDIDLSATAARRKMHKLHVYVVGGDYADNGVDQLIIDGEAMPVLKALIKEGKSPGVGEGAVRLLTRLCSTPEARQEVRSASLPHNVFHTVLPVLCQRTAS